MSISGRQAGNYAADLGNPNLHPDELASLGSKRVCNPEELMIFKTLKARATSLLERTGIRFLNGWAIADFDLLKKTSMTDIEPMSGTFFRISWLNENLPIFIQVAEIT